MNDKADRVEFERLHIISLDLTMAARFLEAYLDRALYESLGPPDGVLAEALAVAIIVTYAKSFTVNRNRFKMRDLCPSFLTDSLSYKQRGLHDHILNERHQAFGHSMPVGRTLES